MRHNKIMQGDRLSGLMVQRLRLVQNEVIYMVRSMIFGRARGKMVLSAKPHGNVRRVSIAAGHLLII